MPVRRDKKRNKCDIIPGEALYKLNGVTMRSIRSSSVRAAGYDERNMVLYIEFASGTTYEYLDVPNYDYVNLINTPSPGRFVNNVLTLKYEYRDISNNMSMAS